ncbi:MAG TPA: CHRD domain-containing protein [Actinomycetota bacterium]|nr:CHRD domain-containing protein [Actinomycetota bacterium]
MGRTGCSAGANRISPQRSVAPSREPATEFGAVVVPLFVNATFPGTGETSGCTTDVDPALIKAIRQNPSGHYVNVHSTSFLPRAIRGQLGK